MWLPAPLLEVAGWPPRRAAAAVGQDSVFGPGVAIVRSPVQSLHTGGQARVGAGTFLCSPALPSCCPGLPAGRDALTEAAPL